jgi:putative transposase
MTVGIESESQAPELTDKSMGIDLGVKDSAIVAFGSEQIVFPNINKGRKVRLLKKLIKHLQRSVSRKYEANKTSKKYNKTRNIEKCEERLRKLHERLSNIRTNYIHQSTSKLIKLLPYEEQTFVKSCSRTVLVRMD